MKNLTKTEVKKQVKELTAIVKNITTYEQAKAVENLMSNETEINYQPISRYDGEPIEAIRYEYKDILAYFYIEDGKARMNECISVYDEWGTEIYDGKVENFKSCFAR